MDSTELLVRARIRYEVGRLRVALPGLAFAAALVVCVLMRPHPSQAPFLGALLLLVVLGAGLYRRISARAVLPGLAAGLVPLVVPALAMQAGMGCGLRDCTNLCLVSCLAGGIVAGGVIAWKSRALAEGRRVFLVAAGGVGTLAGALGCLGFGAMGLLLLIAGIGVILSPTWVLARRPVTA